MKIKFKHILFLFLFSFLFLIMSSDFTFAKSYDANDEKFINYELNGNKSDYINIKNTNGVTTKIAIAKRFDSLQYNGKPIFCNGSYGYSTTTSDICYYNTKGQGYQAKVKANTDSAGRTIFYSSIYGKEKDNTYRMYFPMKQDRLYTSDMQYLYGNQHAFNTSRNFKYYGVKNGTSAFGYRWWNTSASKGSSYCYGSGSSRNCKMWGGQSASQIVNDVKNSNSYLEGLSANNSGEKGEYRYLGYGSMGDMYDNPLFPADYPTTSTIANYKYYDGTPYAILAKNGWGTKGKTVIDNNDALKTQATQIVMNYYNTGGSINTWKNRWSIQGDPNYDPIAALGVNSTATKYMISAVPNRAEALKDMSAKSIKVCEGRISNINDCKVVGEWNSNGSNYYSDGVSKEGSKELIYGQTYTVFTKIYNNSAEATNINGTATGGEGVEIDSNGNVTINGVTKNQGSKINAKTDSQWIPLEPFVAGQKYLNGYEVVVAGVGKDHIDNADDNDINDNYGAIKFKVIPAGDMEIIRIKAYDVNDANNSNPVTDLKNGKEYKFVIDTKFTPTIKGWTSFSKVLMPLNVTVDRVFTNGSSEHNTQIAYPNGSAYQTLSEKEYQYTIYGTAGMPGTDVKVTAEFTKDYSLGFNININGKDKISDTYKVPTISGDLVVTKPVGAIDKNGNRYSTEENNLDSSQTYKLVYEAKYNGDVIVKETNPIKTNYSCYYTNVNSSNANIQCKNVEGLSENGSVSSAYVKVGSQTFNLTKSGNVWNTGNVAVNGNIELYVNNQKRGAFSHDLSTPVYRGAGYPSINNVQMSGNIVNSGIGLTRETKSYYNIDFAKVAQYNGKNVSFEGVTSTYYGLPLFNHSFYYKTDTNGFAKNAQFLYADMNSQTQKSRVSNLNTNPKNDDYSYKNQVNIAISNVTVFPGKEEMVEGDVCPVYEVRYDVDVTENSVLKNAQGLVTVKITIAGKTYTFEDYLVEGKNSKISHILPDVDCSKIVGGNEDVTVTINPNKEVNETTHNDNTGKTKTELDVIKKEPIVDSGMDISKDMGYKCDVTSNTISWNESHTTKTWKQTFLGDVYGFTSSTSTSSKLYKESYRIKEIGFASKDTKWEKVDLLTNPDKAKIKAGYGFKLTSVVEYNSNVLANNIALDNKNNGTSGKQVSNLNIEAYIPTVVYAKYNGVTYALYATSTTNSNGSIVRTYAYNGTYNGKATNKIFTDVNMPDGKQPITVFTPKIIGIPTHLNKCLQDTKNVTFTIDGSMYDDMNSHITQ